MSAHFFAWKIMQSRLKLFCAHVPKLADVTRSALKVLATRDEMEYWVLTPYNRKARCKPWTSAALMRASPADCFSYCKIPRKFILFFSRPPRRGFAKSTQSHRPEPIMSIFPDPERTSRLSASLPTHSSIYQQRCFFRLIDSPFFIVLYFWRLKQKDPWSMINYQISNYPK